MVGLDRYAGAREGSFVQLRDSDNLKNVGNSTFMGKIVKLHTSIQSLTNTRLQDANRKVRQDFFVELKKTNSEIARQYADRLVGHDIEKKPLSGRLVRQILEEVGAADQEVRRVVREKAAFLPDAKLSLTGRIATIIDIATRTPELRDDLRQTLRTATFLITDGMKCSFSAARDELARRLVHEHGKLSPTEQHNFISVLGPLDELAATIAREVGELKGDEQTTVRTYDQYSGLPAHTHDPDAMPQKSILKAPRQVEGHDAESAALSAATMWLSEAEDRVLDGLGEQHFAPKFVAMIAEFNDNLPDERKIKYSDIIEHKSLDIEGDVMEAVSRLSKKGREPVDDQALQAAAKQSVTGSLSLTPLVKELQALQNDPALSPKAKAEAAHRLIAELGPEMNEIQKIKDSDERTYHFEALFRQNRALVATL